MNPHPKTIIDEVSGIEIESQRYLDYQDGMKEVAGWINRNVELVSYLDKAWQIQLEEWRIE